MKSAPPLRALMLVVLLCLVGTLLLGSVHANPNNASVALPAEDTTLAHVSHQQSLDQPTLAPELIFPPPIKSKYP